MAGLGRPAPLPRGLGVPARCLVLVGRAPRWFLRVGVGVGVPRAGRARLAWPRVRIYTRQAARPRWAGRPSSAHRVTGTKGEGGLQLAWRGVAVSLPGTTRREVVVVVLRMWSWLDSLPQSHHCGRCWHRPGSKNDLASGAVARGHLLALQLLLSLPEA